MHCRTRSFRCRCSTFVASRCHLYWWSCGVTKSSCLSRYV